MEICRKKYILKMIFNSDVEKKGLKEIRSLSFEQIQFTISTNMIFVKICFVICPNMISNVEEVRIYPVNSF